MERYYIGNDGKIYSNNELVKAYRIMTGHNVLPEVVPEYLHVFRGMKKEINPTVEDFIKAGQRPAAIHFYYHLINDNLDSEKISIKEAKAFIESMEKEVIN